MRLIVTLISAALCESGIKIVTKEGCGWSRLMRGFLRERDVPYEDINTSYVGTAIKKELGIEDATFPAVFLDGKYIGGYTDSIKNPKLLDFISQENKTADHDIVI